MTKNYVRDNCSGHVFAYHNLYDEKSSIMDQTFSMGASMIVEAEATNTAFSAMGGKWDDAICY